MSQNQLVTTAQIKKIQSLDAFDLIMLVSEIHDHGWGVARHTLEKMPEGKRAELSPVKEATHVQQA